MNKLLNKFISQSTKAFFIEKVEEPGYSLLTRIHGYIYGRWTYFYIGVGTGRHPLAGMVKILCRIFTFKPVHSKKRSGRSKIEFANGYHGKTMLVEEAKKLVKVNKNISPGDLEQVIPYTRAREIILKNPDHIVALECPCRVTSRNPCLPMDVCLIIGEPFAGFVLEHHPRKARRISGNEATRILDSEHKRGHVQHAFFKDAMLNRFYAICNCCSCCCGAMQAQRNGIPMLASSGFTVEPVSHKCLGCGECSSSCPFGAICMNEKKPFINEDLCMGCGVCVDICPGKCLVLRRNQKKCPPLDVSGLLDKGNPQSTSGT